MPNAIFDTGVWFAYFVEEDLFHLDAKMLVKRLFAHNEKILLPEVTRFELLNALTHELLNHERVKQIDEELRNMSPYVEVRYGDKNFWDTTLSQNLSRLFLKPMDFIIASYALYWNVEEFYSFDEKLNQALRRIKPEIVKIKIRRSKVIFN